MTHRRWCAAGTVAIGTAMIAHALLGPLGVGVIRLHESSAMETQLLGGELTSLYLVGPLAVIAGLLWWRGQPVGPTLAIGPLGYALYTNIQFVLVPDYVRYAGNNERWFPLYAGVIAASWILIVAAWQARARVQNASIPQPGGRVVGILLTVTNSLFLFAWCASLAALYARGPSAEYLAHPTAFWLVRLMDMSFVIPIGIMTGVGLLRGTSWASNAAGGVVGAQALLATSVAGMAVRMWIVADPSASFGFALALSLVAAIFLGLYGSLMMRTASGVSANLGDVVPGI